ncbi:MULTISPECIES: TetR/AcrR family transcriptional regulator [Pseudofrankia]|uniref:TetR/AcrR family transcriptional regulator n=1 Tax=Pseudofrankia saprophytica TaxID=298655 RepID=UPI000687D88E|nr:MULTISPECIES: TetR/AcrR family transcriptional regulator [Pseudofrankia]OHV33326.1 TetR family transcriptional regulator [Pseudofrankia sp. EUN1h]
MRGIHTRQLLLRTAERLFAVQGIARTSTRQITAEAGISRDAIHYHFGSKAALVLAIVDARTEELRVEIERLFTVNVPDRDVTIRDIAHAMVVAATEMAEHETGRYYHPFLAALMNDPEFRHLVNSRSTPQSEAVVALLTPLTPGLGEAERVYRVACAFVLILSGTGNSGVVEWVNSQVATTHGRLLMMLVDVVTSVLAGNVPAADPPGAPERQAASHGQRPEAASAR